MTFDTHSLLYLCVNDYDLKNRPSQRKLVKEALELLEDLLLHRCTRLEVVRSLHLFQRALFLLVQCFRHINADINQQISRTVTIDIRQTFAAQTQHFSRLSTRVDLHFHFSVDCRNLHGTAQCGSRETQQQVIDQIILVESASRPAHHYAFRHYPCRPLRAAYLLPLRQESSPSLPLRHIRYRRRHTLYTCS